MTYIKTIRDVLAILLITKQNLHLLILEPFCLVHKMYVNNSCIVLEGEGILCTVNKNFNFFTFDIELACSPHFIVTILILIVMIFIMINTDAGEEEVG